ncbi:MAG: alpha/beta hydrolase [Rhodobacteraceae bacterium]|jgi:pimeloyl-ACP methyl ester carboxylesterase|nr:alpha/beta hydrolase [Paracoccaceae bacterium]
MTDFLTTPARRHLAYHRLRGTGPGVVFLGGFGSDMEGTKARFLQGWATARGRAFLRFDYSGHGQSSGRFDEGCIGDWAADARAAVEALTEGPQILIGSSMGGWIALLLARAVPERVAGLIGIAAAPDFTVTTWQDELTEAERAEIIATGRTEKPSAYGAPYAFTRRLFEDGAQNLVLDRPLPLPFPVRLLQGTADVDVLPAVALRLLDHATGPDLRLTLVKDADHRFSTPDDLALIAATLDDLSERGEG